MSDLPRRWRSHRLLLGDRGRPGTVAGHEVVGVHGDDDAVLVEVAIGARRVVYGLGDPAGTRSLLASLAVSGPVWASLPRLGAGPAGVEGAPEGRRPTPSEDLPGLLASTYEPASAWDWFAHDGTGGLTTSRLVERLDPVADAGHIRQCLAEANPSTQADPTAPGEAGWFGAREGGALVGVIGAVSRLGSPGRADLSWHLHGLGVRPSARRRGLGAALTSAALAAAVEAGADWVSLGMYANNDAARAVYERLGFVVDGRFSSYRRRPA